MDSHQFENLNFLGNAERYSPFSHTDGCPSTSSSFPTIDTSGISFDGSGEDMNGSTSPANLTASSGVSVTSPITPIGPGGVTGLYDTTVWPASDYDEVWHQHSTDPENLWPASDDFALANCVMDSLASQDQAVFQPGYFNVKNRPRTNNDPPLSRAVFANSISHQNDRVVGEMVSWPQPQNPMQQPTIEPNATFQNFLPSSPMSEFEPITPLRHNCPSSSMFASSPLLSSSSGILTDQWDVGDSRCVPAAEVYAHHDKQSLPHLLRSSRDFSPVKVQSSKSGVDCEAIIPQNVYACSVPGCVDKNGKPKRFKRQEHKKRHEKTVHKKDAKFPCWVQTGGKACGREFTRRDNLNSHLKKTHGKKSNGQRNSYVATLDERSKYFDEKWKGKLTSDGLPIGHPRWPEIC